MVKMSLGASNSQSSSTSSVSSEHISAYNNAISSLTSFISASDLQGQAYSSAKSYASSVLIPLIQGAILLSEAVSNSVSEFPSRYTSEVAGESLDSEVLEAQIATYQAAYNRTSALLESLMSKEVLNPRTISQVQSAMSRNMSKIRELQEKLDKLLAFDASSPSIFDEISSLESAVAQGLSQVNDGFSTFNGTFSIPSRQELAWVDTISSAWNSYSVTKSYKNTLSKIHNGDALTDEDVQVIYTYSKLHPNDRVDQKVIESLKEFVGDFQHLYDANSMNYDILATVLEQLGIGVQRIGGLVSSFEGIKGPVTVDSKGVSTAFVLVNQRGIGQGLVTNGSTVASIGKWGGRALVGLGFGLGMYYDITNKDKTVGQAVVHNGVSIGVSSGVGIGVTSALSSFFLMSNPVGWAAVGVAATGLVIGTITERIFDAAYDSNYLGLQDGLDNAGEWLDDVGEFVGQAISSGVEGVKRGSVVNTIFDS